MSDERWAQFSPDDRWIAFESNVADRPEVYVAPASRPTEMHRISSNGGTQPRWRRDLQAIIYRDREGHLLEASIRISGNTFAVTSVTPVFATTSSIGGYGYDLSQDGQQALIAVPAERGSEPLTLVENWTGLER
jgi:Tol biopolymer transport system component